MDKVKVYLKVLKKHHFWVLAAVVVIVSASVWSSATGQLEAKFKSDKSKIESAPTSWRECSLTHRMTRSKRESKTCAKRLA